MTRRISLLAALLSLLCLSPLVGCPSSSRNGTASNGGSGSGPDGGTGGAVEDFEFGDLIEDFDPPTLEQLDAQVTWEEGPVLNSMELLRQRQEQEGPPEMTAEEALQTQNTTPEINEQMRAALGRLPQSDQDVDWDASISRHSPGDVKSTNPMMMSSTAEFDIAGLTGAGLFGFNWKFEPYASSDSVEKWFIDEAGLHDKIVMRDDLYWSDGKRMTAHDVEFSFRVIMTSAVPVPAVRTGTDLIKYVKAYDDQTLVFFHKEPLAINVWNINFPIIPKHIYEDSIAEDPTFEKSDYHIKYDRNPVVAGMFQIQERVRGQEIVLQRREGYYMVDGKQVREKPHFKEVRFKVIPDTTTALLALKKSDIEEMQLTPEMWVTQTDGEEFYSRNTKVYDTEWVFWYFGYNCGRPPFNDENVRWAMSYAFDHEEMLERHRYGLDEPCTGIYHPESKWAPDPSPEPLKQDLNKAEELLAKAGWEDTDGDGILDNEIGGQRVPFEFTLICANRPWRIDICNLFRENLESIGIICNVRPMEFTVMQQKMRDHQYQACMAGWGTAAYPDASENLWATDKNRNFGQYSNPVVDQIFVDARKELDEEKRRQLFQKLHMTLWKDQPYTWLFFQTAFYGFNKKLRGYNFSPRGPYNYGPGFDAIWVPAN